ncbi:MAG TPA: sulfatase-like hydrolase/transferase, partial [Balneolaceae bacterium]|nr:sulfatase-like hydrolase/transferase [Balneolaceae bacterium]
MKKSIHYTSKTSAGSYLLKKYVWLLVIVLCPFLSCKTQKKPDSSRPNIVLILADDMGFSDLSYFGSEIPTPNIDKLAEDGFVMTRFYNASRCVPTRASLMTGLYQHEVGLGDMAWKQRNLPVYRGYLNKKGVTRAEALKRGGYTTMMTGKWHLGNPEESWPQNRGFEKFFGVPKGGGIYFWPFLLDR